MNKVDIFDSIIEVIQEESDKNGKLIVSNMEILKEFFTNNNTDGKNVKIIQHQHAQKVKTQQQQPTKSNRVQQNKITNIAQTQQSEQKITDKHLQQNSNSNQTIRSINNDNSPKSEFANQLNNYDLATLKKLTDNCQRCDLCNNRGHGVFGAGNPHAELMFIGEVPTANDNISGTPFNNVDGELLAKMITAMKFSCDEIFITHTVKCHSENERQPYPTEALKCLPYLERQIELVKPKVIVLLGGVPLRYLMKLNNVNNYHGQWLDYHGIKVMPTFSPSYLNRYPTEKGKTWHDLKQVMAFFDR
ncbi:uracil-DNA glycosylase [Lentisphaerota bacterium WC36G]|nr:uracil-DNA glycosylase [Lentisphaerae bacterium WC36]